MQKDTFQIIQVDKQATEMNKTYKWPSGIWKSVHYPQLSEYLPLRKQITANSVKNVEKEEHTFFLTAENVKLSSHCGNLKKVHAELSNDPALPVCCTYLKDFICQNIRESCISQQLLWNQLMFLFAECQ